MANREAQDEPPSSFTAYTLLHAGTPVGTLELIMLDDRVGLSRLIPPSPVPEVVQALQAAWSVIEVPGDLPKYTGGPGALSSKAAGEALQRVAAINAAFSLLDRTGRELHPTGVEYQHPPRGTSTSDLVFWVSFEADDSRVGARVPTPPRTDQPGLSAP